MGDPAAPKPAGVKRLVFKEITEGDFRKFEAESNDADTGGGARDLRFRPYDPFEYIFSTLFPGVKKEQRVRSGKKVSVNVQVGQLHWDEHGREIAREVTFEPPTTARPDEGRIPIVHTYPPLRRFPPTNEGRMLLLFIQRDDDKVFAEFTTEKSLRSGAWEDQVATPILKSLGAKRGSGNLARGYLDFVSGKEYSDA